MGRAIFQPCLVLAFLKLDCLLVAEWQICPRKIGRKEGRKISYYAHATTLGLEYLNFFFNPEPHVQVWFFSIVHPAKLAQLQPQKLFLCKQKRFRKLLCCHFSMSAQLREQWFAYECTMIWVLSWDVTLPTLDSQGMSCVMFCTAFNAHGTNWW